MGALGEEQRVFAGPPWSTKGKVLRIRFASPRAARPAPGATEIQVNWAVANKLQALLEDAGYRVVVTRLLEDEVVTNRHRAEITRRGG